MGEVINMFTYKQDKEEAEMDRQYQKFISLLKYFVFIQESKCEIVNLIFDENGDCNIKDREFNDIDASIENLNIREEIGTELIFDDFIISTLITLAPLSIKIFNKNNAPNKLLETLADIFETRVSFSNRKAKTK